MKFQSQISLKQFIRLSYILFYKKAIVIYLTIVGVIMLVTSLFFYAGIATAIYKDEPPLFQLVCGLFFVFGLPIIIYFSAKKGYYSSSQRLREKIEYEFDDENLKMTGDSFKTEFSWDKVYKIVELSEWVLVYQNKRVVIPIPKHSLTTDNINCLKNLFVRLKKVKVK